MSQQPAVVIIARHGMRLDAADSTWHLSTPTPYDPPLTYGGWNQCRSLGGRIASLLHAREEQALKGVQDEVALQDFGQLDGSQDDEGEKRARKKRRIKHKVVIHSSPFLRCLQTSVAIAAGMAQYTPTVESGKRTQGDKMHSAASPRVRPTEGGLASPGLPPISEPKHTDFAHAIARKVALQHEHRRHRKSRLRVDAFLGEWMNPSYFESITPPPPSAMMLATAKAELMQNEAVEIFTPSASTKASSSSLWGGSANGSRPSTPDDLDIPVRPPTPDSPTRSRANTVESSTNITSNRPGSSFHPSALTSTLPKPETAVYHPPQPHYALSASSQIPRGYVAHARNACTNVDYSWDSSRPPQDWGDGGEYGEEWSHMHKRIRRGLNNMIKWYSRQHDTDDRAEDALGLEQADHYSNGHSADHDEEEEEREDLVLILVTHGAGCNALIGALTNQPVLLDVGMASLTMAVRREDAPPTSTPVYAAETEPHGKRSESPEMVMHTADHYRRRRGSLDMGLSDVYEMRLVASSEHLRPAAGAVGSPSIRPLDSLRQRGAFLEPQPRSNTSSAIGSIRRPSATPTAFLGPHASMGGGSADRASSLPPSAGLWAPPAGGRSPFLRPKEQKPGLFSITSSAGTGDEGGSNGYGKGHGEVEEGMQLLDFSTSPPDSRPTSRGGEVKEEKEKAELVSPPVDSANGTVVGDRVDGANHKESIGDQVAELPVSRGRSQRGLWGSKPTATGQTVVRKPREMPKRRWTVDQE